MAATAVPTLPEGDEWIYEVKLDGYRALILKHDARVEIRSRNDRNLTKAYPSVVEAARRLNAGRVTLDGELVALDPDGRPSFQALQHRGEHPGHRIVFYAFDLLHLEGKDLTSEPLTRRRATLPSVVDDSGILLSLELPGTAAEVVHAVQQLGLEGVVAKRRSSRYDAGQRTTEWLKLKLDRQQEFVIGGYRPGPNGIDALLVGYYQGDELRFAGKIRAGFIPHLRREVFSRLKPLHTPRCPFANLPISKSSRWGGGVTEDEMVEMRWVRPKLVAQIRFVEWTADGLLRHPAFLALRIDKDAQDVRRET